MGPLSPSSQKTGFLLSQVMTGIEAFRFPIPPFPAFPGFYDSRFPIPDSRLMSAAPSSSAVACTIGITRS